MKFMIVEPIWTANALRNVHYLVACPQTGEALAIDTLDVQQCLARAEENGWEITQVLNTHEHRDHIGGNAALIEATGAKLLAHARAGSLIDGIDRGLKAGDVVQVGKMVELHVLDTPGHTMCHICLLYDTDVPALFSGDTIFAAGAGNCRGGGDPTQLFETFSQQLSQLADNTRVYPGHDYIANNLDFTLDREPDNARAAALRREVSQAKKPFITTIGLEREVNTFLRLTNKTVIRRLRDRFPDMPEQPSPKEVFVGLRALRDKW